MKILASIKKERYLLAILLVLVLAAILRFYRLTDTFDFNGDLGRDALIAKRIVVDHKLTLIGPRASGGDFFLGPFYYYLIIPSLLLFNFSALGPVYLTIFFSLLTIILVYKAASEFFDKKVGLLAAALYATSPLVVQYSRVSGNYAPLPFFSLLAIYSFWHWLKQKKERDLILAAVFLGLAVQLHYSVIVLTVFFFLCLPIYRVNPFRYLRQFLLSGLAFVGLNLPLLVFDLRHNWINTKGIIGYLTEGSGDNVRRIIGLPPWSFIGSLEYFSQVLTTAVSPFLTGYWLVFLFLLLAFIVFLTWKRKIKKELYFLILLTAFALIFSSFYKGYFVGYYLAFIFAVPIIIVAYLIVSVAEMTKRQWLVGVGLLVYLTTVSQQNLTIQKIGRDFKEVLKAGRIIAAQVKPAERFNIFLLRPEPFWSTAAEYRYLAEKEGPKALEPTAYREADYLYFVDETGKANPLNTLNWEVTEFGPKRVMGKWQIDKITVYKLGR